GSTYYGNFNFGSTTNNPLDTGHGYANVLLGIYQTYGEASNRAVPNVHFSELDWYVQDSWRATRHLTIDYGLRFVHESPVTDDSQTYSNFYQQLWNPAQAPRLYRNGCKIAVAPGGTCATANQVAIDPLTGATTYNSLVGTIIPGSGNPVDGMHIDGLSG